MIYNTLIFERSNLYTSVFYVKTKIHAEQILEYINNEK